MPKKTNLPQEGALNINKKLRKIQVNKKNQHEVGNQILYVNDIKTQHFDTKNNNGKLWLDNFSWIFNCATMF